MASTLSCSFARPLPVVGWAIPGIMCSRPWTGYRKTQTLATTWKWKPTPGEVLPEELRSFDVVEQITKEYRWTLEALGERGLGQ